MRCPGMSSIAMLKHSKYPTAPLSTHCSIPEHVGTRSRENGSNIFYSAASVTSAGATSASSAHLPVSAPHGAGLIAAASAAQEEMVSTIMQSLWWEKGSKLVCIVDILNSEPIFPWRKKSLDGL